MLGFDLKPAMRDHMKVLLFDMVWFESN